MCSKIAYLNSRPLIEKIGPSQIIVAKKTKNRLSVNWGWRPPQSKTVITVKPGDTDINRTINRAELARTAAALINERTHIATDGTSALWQIRNSILYPLPTKHDMVQTQQTRKYRTPH
jgi:hypothetical protein